MLPVVNVAFCVAVTMVCPSFVVQFKAGWELWCCSCIALIFLYEEIPLLMLLAPEPWGSGV